MVTVAFGSDVYGAVRKVDGTPIVTKFAMFQFLPIYPLQSYFLGRLGPHRFEGIPVILGQTSQEIVGLPLARIDRLSVCMAYLRALIAAVLLLSAMGLFFGWISGGENPRLQESRKIILANSGLGIAFALIFGLPTYGFTFLVPKREKKIRQACGQWLGIAADPAQVDVNTTRALLTVIDNALIQNEITNPAQLIQSRARVSPEVGAILLLWVRAQMAVRGDREVLDQATDDLLQAHDPT